jgi:hypothetical protein
MRKYLRLIFKGLGILSLVIAVGFFVAQFFLGESATYEGDRDHCESHYCISTGPKGSEKFKGCVSDCMGKMGFIYRGTYLTRSHIIADLLLPGGIIFFIVLGIILLIISYVISLPWDDNGSNKEDEI